MVGGLSSGLLAATSLFSITAIIQLFRTDWKVKNSYKKFSLKSKCLLVTIYFKAPHFYHNSNNSEKLTGGFFGFYFVMYLLYSTLLNLPPLSFHCFGGC